MAVTQITFVADQEQHEKIKEIATREQVSVSAVVRWAVGDFLQKNTTIGSKKYIIPMDQSPKSQTA